jgi:hypothetical protein
MVTVRAGGAEGLSSRQSVTGWGEKVGGWVGRGSAVGGERREVFLHHRGRATCVECSGRRLIVAAHACESQCLGNWQGLDTACSLQSRDPRRPTTRLQSTMLCISFAGEQARECRLQASTCAYCRRPLVRRASLQSHHHPIAGWRMIRPNCHLRPSLPVTRHAHTARMHVQKILRRHSASACPSERSVHGR